MWGYTTHLRLRWCVHRRRRSYRSPRRYFDARNQPLCAVEAGGGLGGETGRRQEAAAAHGHSRHCRGCREAHRRQRGSCVVAAATPVQPPVLRPSFRLGSGMPWRQRAHTRLQVVRYYYVAMCRRPPSTFGGEHGAHTHTWTNAQSKLLNQCHARSSDHLILLGKNCIVLGKAPKMLLPDATHAGLHAWRWDAAEFHVCVPLL